MYFISTPKNDWQKTVAGGDKYFFQGIYFKFAVDSANLFGGDVGAIKVAGHEVSHQKSFLIIFLLRQNLGIILGIFWSFCLSRKIFFRRGSRFLEIFWCSCVKMNSYTYLLLWLCRNCFCVRGFAAQKITFAALPYRIRKNESLQS